MTTRPGFGQSQSDELKLAGDNVPGKKPHNQFVPTGRRNMKMGFHRPFPPTRRVKAPLRRDGGRTDYILGVDPGTLCQANFRLSLRDEEKYYYRHESAHSPPVKARADSRRLLRLKMPIFFKNNLFAFRVGVHVLMDDGR